MAGSSIEWEAFDRTPQHHSPDWYWAAGIVALSIAVISVIFDNTLFAVLIVISTIALFLRTLQKPRRIRYAITSKGFWREKNFMSYAELESFCVEETGRPQLIIKPRGLLTPLFIVPMEDTDADAVSAFLALYLSQEKLSEPFSKKIMEFLGF